MDFHEAMDNLGFFSIESLSIHRLIDNEVTKLSFLVGDDLWSMLMKIIACDELIEMMERKKGIVKKRSLKRTFNNYAEKVVQILPKKIQLKKDIHTQLTLQNHFYGLLEIIQNRHNIILSYQMDTLDEIIDPLIRDIKTKYFERFEKEIAFASICQQRENTRILRLVTERVQNNFDESISELMQYSPPSFFLQDFFKILEELESTKEELPCNDKYELIGWKILLKENEDDHLLLLSNAIGVGREVTNILNNYVVSIEEDLKTLEDKIENFSSEQLTKDLKDYHKYERKTLRAYLKTEDNIIYQRNEIANQLDKICTSIFIAHIPQKYKNDLMTIEDLVQIHDDLQSEYHGPLFKYLDPSSMSIKLWPQLMSATNLILFETTEMAEKAAFHIHDLKANSSCTFVGIDKFLKNSKTKDIHEDIMTAKLLIKADVQEPLKSAIMQILSRFVLIDKIDPPKENDLIVTCYDEVVSTIYHVDGIAVVSQLSNSIWSKYETNPIKSLTDFYIMIERRNKLTNEIKKLEQLREDGINALKGEELSIINKSSRQKVKKIFDTMLHATLSINLSYLSNDEQNESFEKLLCSYETDLHTWNISALKDELEIYYSKYNPYEENLSHQFQVLSTFVNNHPADKQLFFEDINEEYYKVRIDAIKDKLKLYKRYQENFAENILKMYDNLIDQMKDNNFDFQESVEINTNFGYALAQKSLISTLIDSLKSLLKIGLVTKSKHEMFEKYQNKPDQEVVNKIAEIHGQLFKEKNEKHLRLTNLTAESYTKLKESIEKVPKYAEQEVFTPLEVKKRAYPMMNFLVVKMLRDTVHHFKVTYNVIFSDYISQSSLFFYTQGDINEELEEDKFSWNCFDMTRLKSIDFVDKWEAGYKSKIGVEKIKQIKAFLLILHMINYISIFKFIIVSSKIFEGLNEALEFKIREFLKTISTYIQVIIIEEDPCHDLVEAMDTD